MIQTKSGWMSAESRMPVPAGQRGPTEITVGTNEPGLVVVAWRAYPVTEGPTGIVNAAASVLPVGSNRLGPSQVLGRGDLVGYPRGPIVATLDAAGRPAVAWTVPAKPNVSVPMVAQADNAGRFGPPQALAASGLLRRADPPGRRARRRLPQRDARRRGPRRPAGRVRRAARRRRGVRAG